MKILTYRELESDSKKALLPLLDHAFRWPFNPRRFEEFVKIDPRLKNSPVGFCAIEDERLVGFVGVLDLATRIVETTIEYVGGVYGVATLPSHVRKGVSTALMKRAHEHFREKGYRFSFLTTSRTIIAHDFYAKLGYKVVIDYPSAYKVLEPKKTRTAQKEKVPKVDFERILRIYGGYVRDKTGFVVRSKDDLKTLRKDHVLTPRNWIVDEAGYAIFRKDDGGIWIREVVATSPQAIERLIARIEGKAKDVVYDRAVTDKNVLRVYQSRRYMIEERSHSVMMAAPLTPTATVRQAYGDRFYISGLDNF